MSRRRFLQAALLVAPSLTGAGQQRGATEQEGFSFVLLGDLHYDRLDHHDLDWLAREKPDDLRQVRDYSRITAEIMPELFAGVRRGMTAVKEAGLPAVDLVVQAGDFVEGLCGSETLAIRQNQEAVGMVDQAGLGVPFLFTKGNHDITGPGASEAYRKVFHPFLDRQAKRLQGKGPAASGHYSVAHAGALFVFYDAYDRDSLAWLEARLSQRTSSTSHCFVVVHPPVVPYGARSTWHLYSADRQKAEREKLMELLGQHHAMVLGGHLHKYSVLVRETAGGGRILQLGLNSVVSRFEVKLQSQRSGTEHYSGNQVNLEPDFSPATERERRAVYETESPWVRHFEYADLPGYAIITVRGASVQARVFAGVGRDVWRTLDLSELT